MEILVNFLKKFKLNISKESKDTIDYAKRTLTHPAIMLFTGSYLILVCKTYKPLVAFLLFQMFMLYISIEIHKSGIDSLNEYHDEAHKSLMSIYNSLHLNRDRSAKLEQQMIILIPLVNALLEYNQFKLPEGKDLKTYIEETIAAFDADYQAKVKDLTEHAQWLDKVNTLEDLEKGNQQ